jgi:ABC-type glycerol-3-phosphate transport system permease component
MQTKTHFKSFFERLYSFCICALCMLCGVVFSFVVMIFMMQLRCTNDHIALAMAFTFIAVSLVLCVQHFRKYHEYLKAKYLVDEIR